MVAYKDVRKIEDSLQTNAPTLGRMTRELGEKKIHSYLKMWLINLEQTTNLKRGLSEAMIEETAYYIMMDNKNLTISDINLIFKEAKTGGYGEFYESLTMAKILGWFREYYSERMEVASMLSQREAHTHKTPAKRSSGQSFKDFIKTGIKK